MVCGRMQSATNLARHRGVVARSGTPEGGIGPDGAESLDEEEGAKGGRYRLDGG